MRVGVIDVGANTLRLLVGAPNGKGGVLAVQQARSHLGLGEHVEDGGAIPRDAIAATVNAARRMVASAQRLGCVRVEIVVTSPGRQAANGAELASGLSGLRGVSVRVLDAEEEGRLAFLGAVAGLDSLPESVAVCDVGGGSVQLVVGTRSSGPAWFRSLDVGSLRLARRFGRSLARGGRSEMELEVASAFADLAPPLPQAALATGGTARALKKLVGPVLGPEQLAQALDALSPPPKRLAKTLEVTVARARTLPAGTVILAEAQRRLGVPLQVARGGVREGVVLELLDAAAAA